MAELNSIKDRGDYRGLASSDETTVYARDSGRAHAALAGTDVRDEADITPSGTRRTVLGGNRSRTSVQGFLNWRITATKTHRTTAIADSIS